MSLVPLFEHVASLDPCQNQHAQNWFIPVSYFTKHKMETTVAKIDAVLAVSLQSSEPDSGITEFNRARTTSTIPVSNIKLIGETFLKMWSSGSPFISADAIQEVKPETFSNFPVSTNLMCVVEFFDGYSWRQANHCSVEEFLNSCTPEQNWPRQVLVSLAFCG